jgi:Anti-sigma-K factor rskA
MNNAPPFPAWLGWGSLAAAACFALMALTFRVGQDHLATRAHVAEETARLADAEARATRNQLEAERILAAAQSRQWQAADAELTRLRAELAAARSEADQRIATLRIAKLEAQTSQPDDAQGVVVWDAATQQGVLTVAKLPGIDADRDYQLWIMDPGYPTLVSAGVFTVEPASGEARFLFKAAKPVSSIAAFAVSVERKGGVPMSEGPMVLVGK